MEYVINTQRAIFQAEGENDVEVRVLSDHLGTNFSAFERLPEDEIEGLAATKKTVPTGKELQVAEALQFVADVIGAKVPGRLSPFVRGWVDAAATAHYIAKEKGFWKDSVDRNNGEMLCLIHAELSEALEALRNGNPPDGKLPEFSSVEVELADVVIRLMDLAYARGWRVAQAVEAKMKYNSNRPHKHGKEF